MRSNKGTWLLLAPGMIWILLFLVAPLIMMVYVSFWTQTTFSIKPDLTTQSWVNFFSSDTYFGALLRTIRIWLTVLFVTLVIGYPVALFIGQFIKNKTLQTALLVTCVIPFWTSFLIRVLAWRPMLGKEGAINIILQKIGFIDAPIEVLLFTELSVDESVVTGAIFMSPDPPQPTKRPPAAIPHKTRRERETFHFMFEPHN